MAGVDANGHFNIPEGTATIVGRDPYGDGGEADSWAEWGVEKTTVRSVTIPASVTSIRGHAFVGCSSLAAVSIPTSVTSIGGGAFADCSSLAAGPIPTSVTSINI